MRHAGAIAKTRTLMKQKYSQLEQLATQANEENSHTSPYAEYIHNENVYTIAYDKYSRRIVAARATI
jgi:hypothetical protein